MPRIRAKYDNYSAPLKPWRQRREETIARAAGRGFSRPNPHRNEAADRKRFRLDVDRLIEEGVLIPVKERLGRRLTRTYIRQAPGAVPEPESVVVPQPYAKRKLAMEEFEAANS